MNQIRISRHRRSKGAEINMAPLIDMIFILLIFFIVTTSFIKETSVDIQRPGADSAKIKEKINIMVELTKQGIIYIEGKHIDIRSIKSRMKRFAIENPMGSVLIVADKESQTGLVIQILDQCRLAGIENISVAARRPGA